MGRFTTMAILALAIGIAGSYFQQALASGLNPGPYPNNQPPAPVTANPPICGVQVGSPDAGPGWCAVYPKNTCLRIASGFTATLQYRKGQAPDGGPAQVTDNALGSGPTIEKGCLANAYPDGGSDYMPDGGALVCFLLSAAAPEAGASTCP